MPLALRTPARAAALAAGALTVPVAAPAARAADGETTPLNLGDAPVQAAEAAGGGGGLVRTIVGLVVVVALIYGLTWVLRQVKGAREERASGTGLHPLATLPLGPNRALHLVRAGREILLLGSGERGVTPIRTYTADEARKLGLLDEHGIGHDLGGGGTGSGSAPGRGGLVDSLRRRTELR